MSVCIFIEWVNWVRSISGIFEVFSFKDVPLFTMPKFVLILNTSFVVAAAAAVVVVVFCMLFVCIHMCKNVYQCIQSDLYSDWSPLLVIVFLFSFVLRFHFLLFSILFFSFTTLRYGILKVLFLQCCLS